MGVTADRRAYNAAYYTANREKILAANARRRSDPETRARNLARQRERRRERIAAGTERRLPTERETERSWVRRLRLLGLTPADYTRMLAEQGGRCAICRTDRPWLRGGRWAVDHDHSTEQVRGLLCHRCNTALGLVGDSRDVLAAMIEYLRRWGQR